MISISNNLPFVLIDENAKEKQTRKKHHKSTTDNGVELVFGELNPKQATYIMPVSAVSRAHMENLKKQYEEYLEPFKTFLDNLINRQMQLAERESNDSIISLEDDDITKLNALISDDGEFGRIKTADRIVGFAKAISGGDKSKIPQIKEAVCNAFLAAENIPDAVFELSEKTREEVMKRLDEWLLEE